MTKDQTFFFDCLTGSKKMAESKARPQSELLARAEHDARNHGFSFAWSMDWAACGLPAEMSDEEEADETPPWVRWECIAFDATGTKCGGIKSIDFGLNITPYGSTRRRLEEAKLALSLLRKCDSSYSSR